MFDDLDEAVLEELEVGIQQFANGASNMITRMDSTISKMDRIIQKVELLNSKINAITESDKDNSSQLVQNEVAVSAMEDFSRLDRIEAIMRRIGLIDDPLPCEDPSYTVHPRQTHGSFLQSEIKCQYSHPSQASATHPLLTSIEPNFERSDEIDEPVELASLPPSFSILQSAISTEIETVDPICVVPFVKSSICMLESRPLVHEVYFSQTEDHFLDWPELVGATLTLATKQIEVWTVHKFFSPITFILLGYHDSTHCQGIIHRLIFDPGISFPLTLFMEGDLSSCKCLPEEFEPRDQFMVPNNNYCQWDDAYSETKLILLLKINSRQIFRISLYGDTFTARSVHLNLSILAMNPLSWLKLFARFSSLILVFDPGIMMIDWCLYDFGECNYWPCWSCWLLGALTSFISSTASPCALEVDCTVLELFREHDKSIFNDITTSEQISCIELIVAFTVNGSIFIFLLKCCIVTGSLCYNNCLWASIMLPPLLPTLVKTPLFWVKHLAPTEMQISEEWTSYCESVLFTHSSLKAYQGLNQLLQTCTVRDTQCFIDLVIYIPLQFHYTGDLGVEGICFSYICITFLPNLALPQQFSAVIKILLQIGLLSGYFLWSWPMESLDVYEPKKYFLVFGMTKLYKLMTCVSLDMGYSYNSVAIILVMLNMHAGVTIIMASYLDVALGPYNHLDSLHLNHTIVWEDKLQPRFPLFFPLIVMVQLRLERSVVPSYVPSCFSWSSHILFRWNGLNPPIWTTLGASQAIFSKFDLEDKVYFNGGGNVTVTKYLDLVDGPREGCNGPGGIGPVIWSKRRPSKVG